MTTPSGKVGSSVDRVDAADDDRLRLFGNETGREQAVGEIGRTIVPVQLPLERLAALGEDLDLPRDQRVELLAVEAGQVAILDESSIAESGGSKERAVSLDLDGIGEPVVHVRAQLRVVGSQQRSGVVVVRHAPACSRRSNSSMRRRRRSLSCFFSPRRART